MLGADIEDTDKNSRTSLILAAWKGHTNTVKFLLSKGARVETKDNDDDTALLLAAQEGHVSTVRELLLQGAPFEETALVAATQGGHWGTARELQQRKDGLAKEFVLRSEVGREVAKPCSFPILCAGRSKVSRGTPPVPVWWRRWRLDL